MAEKRVRLFKQLRRKLDYLDQVQIDAINQAYLVAFEAHEGQFRQSGEPYITHPVAVACILADMQMDYQTLMAALMHDVIEDTHIEKSTIAKQFGNEVADLVDGVTKLGKIEMQTRAEAQAENFRKMVLAMSRDIRVIIVKLADRLHNTRTLDAVSNEKRRRIAKETLEIYALIANRLGIHKISSELQDLGFAALYPKRYKALKDSILRITGRRHNVINEVEKTIKKNLSHAGVADFEVKGREKHLYSIYRKMRDKNIAFSEIMDVYACRILVDDVEACYRVLGLVHALYKPLPARFKDYIAIPKANGYQSLHTTLFGPKGVPIELQIRTREMDRWADNGIAAHWMYKTGEATNDTAQLRAEQWVKNLLDLQQNAGNSLEFIENVKIDLFPDEIYVFTPRGKIMALPKGASPVDFAYAVHTDIGNSCVAAKIDRQLIPLSASLSSGVTVEIITAHGAYPNSSWLDFVVTGKARSSIRQFLKHRRQSESVALGKRLLNKALAIYKSSLKKIPKQNMPAVLTETGVESQDHLFEEIGLGNRLALVVAQQLLGVDAKLITPHQAKATPLLIKGTEGMVIRFTECCYPIPGDPVVGIIQSGKGILVHHEQCKRITKIRTNPEKCMSVSWSKDIVGEFKVPVRIEVLHQRGVLAVVAKSIADAGANIEDVTVDERTGSHYFIRVMVLVDHRKHLADVMRNLRGLEFVTKVERVRD